MVVVPSGDFLMGVSDIEKAHDLADIPGPDNGIWEGIWASELGAAKKAALQQQPQHKVHIPTPFGVSVYRVTKGEFADFVEDSGYSLQRGCWVEFQNTLKFNSSASWKNPGFPQTDRDPAVCVSLHDAEAYVVWLNRQPGEAPIGRYRLPSEAEWEYMARAGTTTTRWWGDAIGVNNADCTRCGSQWDKVRTAPAGSFNKNQFGVADVLGNAWEWNDDCWNETYESAPSDGSSWQTGACDRRVVRGGGWDGDPWIVTSTHRTSLPMTDRSSDLGFRVVEPLDRPKASN
jgi:formylglycine-generating enzyme required for sulfatase activity